MVFIHFFCCCCSGLPGKKWSGVEIFIWYFLEIRVVCGTHTSRWNITYRVWTARIRYSVEKLYFIIFFKWRIIPQWVIEVRQRSRQSTVNTYLTDTYFSSKCAVLLSLSCSLSPSFIYLPQNQPDSQLKYISEIGEETHTVEAHTFVGLKFRWDFI